MSANEKGGARRIIDPPVLTQHSPVFVAEKSIFLVFDADQSIFLSFSQVHSKLVLFRVAPTTNVWCVSRSYTANCTADGYCRLTRAILLGDSFEQSRRGENSRQNGAEGGCEIYHEHSLKKKN